MAAKDVFSHETGAALESTNVSINDTRRMFNFGERIAELAPQQSPFFVYLSKVAKKTTDDPVFKFLEQRHQWQRRNFELEAGANPSGAISKGTALGASGTKYKFGCNYDIKGNIKATYLEPCHFLVPGLVLAIGSSDGGVYRVKIKDGATSIATTAQASTNDGYVQIDADELIAAEDIPDAANFATGQKGQVIGSSWAEGSTAPDGWEDQMFDREGYTQIFKTAINLFSGTAMATKYRGIANEYQRVWTEKLMEHKMDLEHAFLFGVGSADESAATEGPVRYTHGILPYTQAHGKQYDFTYASSGYDAFLDAMEDFFAPEGGNSGNKLVLASRKVITYLNKLGQGSFLNNSVGSSQYSLDVQNIKGAFGHQVTKVNTIYGDLHFVSDPLLRGPWENYCVGVDMKNVAYRPLAGNGVNRDTFIETNIQNNDVDGRKDQIITEAGLEISLPETHAVMKWS